jgi:DNA-directed RNA polymerase specialized sigma24 family protein
LQCCQQVNAEIVRLREDGLTYKGIAQQLEVSVAKVGATLSRAGCVVRPKRTRSTLTI